MMELLAQVEYGPLAVKPYSTEWLIGLIVTFLLAAGAAIGLSKVPANFRRPIVSIGTFLCGLIYVLYWLWPRPVNLKPDQVPNGMVEQVGKGLSDTLPLLADVANILTSFLLGLGVYSLARIHFGKIIKRQSDRGFSWVLIVSATMISVFGFVDYILRSQDKAGKLVDRENWGFFNVGQDIMFDGLLLQMDSVMFSLIAFFILSAAYRAFRIRSVESTVMMASALVLMLSLLSPIMFQWNTMIAQMAKGMNIPNADPSIPYPGGFFHNLQISDWANWVKGNLQTPALRAVDFGILLGALAMGLRLWLGLEKGGVSV
ncbi:MAG: hypothetical protein JNM34_04890 [Chthonomonadaceae bacterium]|nr:hypothetical protein [Chthonomonadaceae bacterium]